MWPALLIMIKVVNSLIIILSGRTVASGLAAESKQCRMQEVVNNDVVLMLH